MKSNDSSGLPPPQNTNRKEQHTILNLPRSTAPAEIDSNVSSSVQPTRRPDPFEPRQVLSFAAVQPIPIGPPSTLIRILPKQVESSPDGINRNWAIVLCSGPTLRSVASATRHLCFCPSDRSFRKELRQLFRDSCLSALSAGKEEQQSTGSFLSRLPPSKGTPTINRRFLRSPAPLGWKDTNLSGFQPTHRPDPFELRQVICVLMGLPAQLGQHNYETVMFYFLGLFCSGAPATTPACSYTSDRFHRTELRQVFFIGAVESIQIQAALPSTGFSLNESTRVRVESTGTGQSFSIWLQRSAHLQQ